MDIPNLRLRYFYYSKSEHDKAIKADPGKKFGTVSVNGVSKTYTNIVTDPKLAPADGIFIIKGDIKKIRYT